MSGVLNRFKNFPARLRHSESKQASQWIEPSSSVTKAILADDARRYYADDEAPPAATAQAAPERAEAQHPANNPEGPANEGDSRQHGSAA